MGEWSSRDGDIDPAPYALGMGQIDVLLIRWKGEARDGVRALAELAPGEPLLAAELARLEAPVETPEG